MIFEKRLEAYRLVNEDLYTELTPIQWLPLLYCALFLSTIVMNWL